MSKLRLTFACGPYDRTLALRDGTIQPEGIDLNYVALQPSDIFWRMLQFKEFEISEMSLSNHTTLVSTGNAPFIAIPVFPSRVFRHGYFFINAGKGINSPADLKGKRGGVPEYTMTAAVYMRGLLQHEYGVKPSDVEWVQGRADRLGRKLPPDIRLRQAPAGTELGDLLERGEIDFLMTANNPLAFRRGAATVRRLFPNYAEVEKDYYRRTKIYPIMHTVVIRRDVHEAQPVGGAQPVQGAVPREGARLSSAGGHGLAQGLVGVAAAADRGGEGDHRAGLVSLRHRAEPAVDRGAAAIHPRTRTDRPPRQAGGAVRAQHAARHPDERRPACVE